MLPGGTLTKTSRVKARFLFRGTLALDCSPSLSVSRARFLPFGAAIDLVVALVALPFLGSSGSGVVAGVSLTEPSTLRAGELTDEGLVDAADLRVVGLVLTMVSAEKDETNHNGTRFVVTKGTRRENK